MIDENKLIEDLIPILNKNDDMALAGKIIGTIDRQPKVGVWIPVSERLPEEANSYEVTIEYNSKQRTGVAYYSTEEHRWSTYTAFVTAWRERLPEPYKAGEHEWKKYIHTEWKDQWKNDGVDLNINGANMQIVTDIVQ